MNYSITDIDTGVTTDYTAATATLYRLYPDGEIIHQDDFDERDSDPQPFDDYGTYLVPDDISAAAIMRTPDYPRELKEFLVETILIDSSKIGTPSQSLAYIQREAIETMLEAVTGYSVPNGYDSDWVISTYDIKEYADQLTKEIKK